MKPFFSVVPLVLMLACAGPEPVTGSTYLELTTVPSASKEITASDDTTISVVHSDDEITRILLSQPLPAPLKSDYYAGPFLSGYCLCRQSLDALLEVPCTNISVILTDEQGQELSRVFTEDGEFVFPIERDKAYRLKFQSARHTVMSTPEPPAFANRVPGEINDVRPNIISRRDLPASVSFGPIHTVDEGMVIHLVSSSQ